MRFLSLLFLIVFVAAIGVFAYQNQHEITVAFLNWEVTANVSLVAGAAFLLGMFTGWSIVGLLRRSYYNVTHDTAPRGHYAYR